MTKEVKEDTPVENKTVDMGNPAESVAGNPTPPEPPKTDPDAEAKAKAAAEKAEADKTETEKALEKEAAEKEEADKKAAEEAEEAAKKEAEEEAARQEANDAIDETKWARTGDSVADSIILMLQEAGADPEAAQAILFQPIIDGKTESIDQSKLAELVGDKQAPVIMAAARDYVARTAARTEAVTSAVNKAAGSEENWNKVAEWSKANLTEAELNDARTMIHAGGMQAEFAAQQLVNRYNGDAKNTSLVTAETTQLSGDTVAAPQGRALSKSDAYKELNKAFARGKTESDPVVQEIRAARRRGIAKNL